MDPEVHARFLDYLELREYFARPDLPKLDAKTFTELHLELEALIVRERAGEIDADGLHRLGALRQVLLRD